MDDDMQSKTLFRIIVFVMLLYTLLVLTIGILLGFMYGTGVQEQVLIDQMMIRDLRLQLCEMPNNKSIDIYGKSEVYIMVNQSNIRQWREYRGINGSPPNVVHNIEAEYAMT